jgi:hypothetical protein
MPRLPLWGRQSRAALNKRAVPPRAASASGVRYRLRELSSRYLAIPQRALAALRSPPRSRSPERRLRAISPTVGGPHH